MGLCRDVPVEEERLAPANRAPNRASEFETQVRADPVALEKVLGAHGPTPGEIDEGKVRVVARRDAALAGNAKPLRRFPCDQGCDSLQRQATLVIAAIEQSGQSGLH